MKSMQTCLPGVPVYYRGRRMKIYSRTNSVTVRLWSRRMTVEYFTIFVRKLIFFFLFNQKCTHRKQINPALTCTILFVCVNYILGRILQMSKFSILCPWSYYGKIKSNFRHDYVCIININSVPVSL